MCLCWFVTRGDALASRTLAPGFHIPRLWRCAITVDDFIMCDMN
jgi:hypothetical protein